MVPPKPKPKSKWEIRADKWMAEQIAKAEAWEKANTWRPRVSSGKGANPYQINYWTLTPGSEPNDMDKLWHTTARRYKNGWVGMTVNDPSPYEREAIAAFLKTLRKKDYLIDHLGDWYIFRGSDNPVGSYDSFSMGIWFKNVDDQTRFVTMLENFPQRTEVIRLGEHADIGGLEHLLEGDNYDIIKGDECSVLTISPNESKAVLIKMFCG